MIRLDGRRIDVADPESWLKGADGRLVLEDEDDLAVVSPVVDRIPVRPFTRPGRTLQMIGLRTWLVTVATTMNLALLSCLLTGFHLLPGETPLYPLSAQLSVFGAMMVACSRNGRSLTRSVRGARTVVRTLETIAWLTVLAGPILIALLATGVLRTS